MKVVTINGSPKRSGNTAFALDTVSGVLRGAGIETSRIEMGTAAIHGCIACGRCAREQDRRCVFDDDLVNRHMDELLEADGIIVGSPVYYAGINGTLKCFLDRVFFVAGQGGGLFRHKVGAAVVAVRRGGEVAAFDQLIKYFTISEMYVPSGTYWNMVFGAQPGEAAGDPEGVQNMQRLGENMAWLMHAMEKGRKDAPLPVGEPKILTNFIR